MLGCPRPAARLPARRLRRPSAATAAGSASRSKKFSCCAHRRGPGREPSPRGAGWSARSRSCAPSCPTRAPDRRAPVGRGRSGLAHERRRAGKPTPARSAGVFPETDDAATAAPLSATCTRSSPAPAPARDAAADPAPPPRPPSRVPLPVLGASGGRRGVGRRISTGSPPRWKKPIPCTPRTLPAVLALDPDHAVRARQPRSPAARSGEIAEAESHYRATNHAAPRRRTRRSTCGRIEDQGAPTRR